MNIIIYGDMEIIKIFNVHNDNMAALDINRNIYVKK